MGHVIALEGTHGSGKSTLAKRIKEVADESGEWGWVLNIHHSRGDSTPEKLDADMRMIEDAPSDTLYIFDRTFLSELVYAPIDGRRSTIEYDPLYWEQYMGGWMDQRGLRLYLTAEPLGSNNLPIVQMYERLTSHTRWVKVEPRKFSDDTLANDVLKAVMNLRRRNEGIGVPPTPEVTQRLSDRRDKNYLCGIEAVAGLERGLYELRNAEGRAENLAAIAHIHYQELQRVRADLDRTLLKPFEREGELDLWTLH